MNLAGLEAALRRIGIDRYMLCLFGTVLLAALLPAQGMVAQGLSQVTFWVVALLFFLYGAKLSLAATWAGLTNWKLQLGVLLCTFALFPLLAQGVQPLATLALPAAVGVGFLYIGCLPSTVQSSIAFTSSALSCLRHRNGNSEFKSFSPVWFLAPSFMFSSTVNRLSALVSWKVRT